MATPKRSPRGLTLRLSKAEAVMLHAALRLLAEMTDHAPREALPKPTVLERLAAKVQALLADNLLEKGEQMATDLIDGIVPEVHITDLHDADFTAPMYDVAERLPVIEQAIAEHRTVAVEYYSLSREEITFRRVDPYALTEQGGLHLLVGYCHWRQAVRVFRADRLKTAALTDERFEIPPAFDLDAYLQQDV